MNKHGSRGPGDRTHPKEFLPNCAPTVLPFSPNRSSLVWWSNPDITLDPPHALAMDTPLTLLLISLRNSYWTDRFSGSRVAIHGLEIVLINNTDIKQVRVVFCHWVKGQRGTLVLRKTHNTGTRVLAAQSERSTWQCCWEKSDRITQFLPHLIDISYVSHRSQEDAKPVCWLTSFQWQTSFAARATKHPRRGVGASCVPRTNCASTTPLNKN